MMTPEEAFFVSPFQEEIWKDNYRDGDETIVDSCRRQAQVIFRDETEAMRKELFEHLYFKKIVFGGRVTANVGTRLKNVFAFNCYAAQRSTKPYDSIKNIFSDIANSAEILKTEGGIGFNYNHLRPRGTLIKGVGVGTPGVCAFMEIQDKVSDVITRGNPGEIIQSDPSDQTKKKIRKGAQMAMLEICHPEIIEYIEAKKIPNKLTKFNMSVIVTDDFMEAVMADGTWDLWFPDIKFEKYDEEWRGDFAEWKEKGYPVVVYQTVQARWLWDLLLKNCYNRNEPGIYFIDNANRFNNLRYYQKVTGTNPCGEISMLADSGVFVYDGVVYEHIGDICNLGSINLPMFYDAAHGFDMDGFRAAVHILVRALDNLIDISGYPMEGLKNAAFLRRKIGAGLMGYGSLLFMMGKRYGSDEANRFTEMLMTVYANEAYLASAQLAEEKGRFPLYDDEKIFEHGFIANSGVLFNQTIAAIAQKGLRNSQILTVAPTGTTSILAGMVSGGVEPVFEKEYVRWVIVNHKRDEELAGKKYPNYLSGEWYETDDFKFSYRGDEQVLVSTCKKYMIDKNNGLRKKVECEDYGWTWAKENFKDHVLKQMDKDGVFACAMDLSVAEHLEPFIIFSKHIDNSISKTVNLRADYPYEEFDALFKRLWQEGVRGLTTYREGTMTAVLETKKETEKTAKDIKKEQKEFFEMWKQHDGDAIVDDVTLPEEYPSRGFIIKSEGKKWYLHVAFKDKAMEKPFAIFVHTNVREADINTYSALEKLILLARTEGIREELIEENEKKCAGASNVNKLCRTIGLLLRHNVSIPLIVKTLELLEVPVGSFVFRIKKFLMRFITEMENGKTCPLCGQKMIFTEGCVKCSSCSYSEC